MRFYLAHFRDGKPLGKNWYPAENRDEIRLLSSPLSHEETELLSDFSRWTKMTEKEREDTVVLYQV